MAKEMLERQSHEGTRKRHASTRPVAHFFDPVAILNAMGLTDSVENAVDFGCGYGTFAIPAAKQIRGTLHGFDIDPAMIAAGEHYLKNAVRPDASTGSAQGTLRVSKGGRQVLNNFVVLRYLSTNGFHAQWNF